MRLENKTICFLGDSITEGVGVTDIAHNRYDHVLQRMYQLKAVHNYGIGGTRLAHQTRPSEKPRHDLCFCGRLYDLSSDADVIVIYGGINDYIHGDAPIGSPEDTTPATFWGAVEFLMKHVKILYPQAVPVFVTPAHSCYGEVREDRPSPRPVKQADAMPVTGYIRILEEKGKQHGIPVLNLYDRLGIDPNDPGDRQTYTADGLHFNDAGHQRLAQCMGEFLAALPEANP